MPTPNPAARLRLTLAYDGTRYQGMQFLPGVPTVQGEVERVLAGLVNHPVRLEAAGRTDAGVHARGQVAHADVATALSPARLRRALNRLLPDDIRVTALRRAAPGFHARFGATGKEYRYLIWNAPLRPPFRRLHWHHVAPRLDLAAMRRAARALTGVHDFAAFTVNPGHGTGPSVRRLDLLRVSRRGDEVVVRLAGEGFLYRMARRLAGYLIQVGLGRADAAAAPARLAARTRHAEIVTAPALGLVLWRVAYAPPEVAAREE